MKISQHMRTCVSKIITSMHFCRKNHIILALWLREKNKTSQNIAWRKYTKYLWPKWQWPWSHSGESITTKIEWEWGSFAPIAMFEINCHLWQEYKAAEILEKISLIKTIPILFQNFLNVHLKWGLHSHWASSSRVLKCFNHFLLVKILLRCSNQTLQTVTQHGNGPLRPHLQFTSVWWWQFSHNFVFTWLVCIQCRLSSSVAWPPKPQTPNWASKGTFLNFGSKKTQL